MPKASSTSEFTARRAVSTPDVSRMQDLSLALTDGYSNTNPGTFTPTQRLPRSSSQESFASQGPVLSSSDLISMLDKVMELVESGFDDNDDLQ